MGRGRPLLGIGGGAYKSTCVEKGCSPTEPQRLGGQPLTSQQQMRVAAYSGVRGRGQRRAVWSAGCAQRAACCKAVLVADAAGASVCSLFRSGTHPSLCSCGDGDSCLCVLPVPVSKGLPLAEGNHFAPNITTATGVGVGVLSHWLIDDRVTIRPFRPQGGHILGCNSYSRAPCRLSGNQFCRLPVSLIACKFPPGGPPP